MPFDGSGLFTSLPPPDYPAVPGTTVKASQFNNNLSDVFGGLTNCLTRDGQGRPTADIDWAGYALRNVGILEVAGTNIIRAIQDSSLILLSSVAGTNTITAVTAPAIPVYALGQIFTFLPTGYNTGAITLNINGLGAKPVVLPNGTACSYRNLSASTYATVFYDGANFRLVRGYMPNLVYSFNAPAGFGMIGFAVARSTGNCAINFQLPEGLLTSPTVVSPSNMANFSLVDCANRATRVLNNMIILGDNPWKGSSVDINLINSAALLTLGASVEFVCNVANSTLTFTGHTW